MRLLLLGVTYVPEPAERDTAAVQRDSERVDALLGAGHDVRCVSLVRGVQPSARWAPLDMSGRAFARELARARRGDGSDTLELLDDPSRGLHPADTAVLLDVLEDLTRTGATVWVATQDPMILDAASVVRLDASSA